MIKMLNKDVLKIIKHDVDDGDLAKFSKTPAGKKAMQEGKMVAFGINIHK